MFDGWNCFHPFDPRWQRMHKQRLLSLPVKWCFYVFCVAQLHAFVHLCRVHPTQGTLTPTWFCSPSAEPLLQTLKQQTQKYYGIAVCSEGLQNSLPLLLQPAHRSSIGYFHYFSFSASAFIGKHKNIKAACIVFMLNEDGKGIIHCISTKLCLLHRYQPTQTTTV